jgi:hypothetical protein
MKGTRSLGTAPSSRRSSTRKNVARRSTSAANTDQVPSPRFNGERARVRGKSVETEARIEVRPSSGCRHLLPVKTGRRDTRHRLAPRQTWRYRPRLLTPELPTNPLLRLRLHLFRRHGHLRRGKYLLHQHLRTIFQRRGRQPQPYDDEPLGRNHRHGLAVMAEQPEGVRR